MGKVKFGEKGKNRTVCRGGVELGSVTPLPSLPLPFVAGASLAGFPGKRPQDAATSLSCPW